MTGWTEAQSERGALKQWRAGHLDHETCTESFPNMLFCWDVLISSFIFLMFCIHDLLLSGSHWGMFLKKIIILKNIIRKKKLKKKKIILYFINF